MAIIDDKAITAAVSNGEVNAKYTNSSAKTNTAGSTDLGYDQFLQLLCAEMQYQDPLEPTSNTDYIAQLATFSQLESTLSMQDSVDKITSSEQMDFAASLVGKSVVVVDPKSSTGYTTGTVDYTMVEDGTIYLSINDTLYSLDSLDTVTTDEYYEAVVTAKSLSSMVSELPEIAELTSSYKTALEQIRSLYDGLSDYQKSFVSKDDLNKLEKYENRMKEILEAEEAARQETVTEEEEVTEAS